MRSFRGTGYRRGGKARLFVLSLMGACAVGAFIVWAAPDSDFAGGRDHMERPLTTHEALIPAPPPWEPDKAASATPGITPERDDPEAVPLPSSRVDALMAALYPEEHRRSCLAAVQESRKQTAALRRMKRRCAGDQRSVLEADQAGSKRQSTHAEGKEKTHEGEPGL